MILPLKFLVLLGTAKALEISVPVNNLRSTIIVSMADGTESVIHAFNLKQFPSREDRLNSLAEALKVHSNKSQEPVRQYLESLRDPLLQIHYLWLQNAIVLKKAPHDLFLYLQTHFGHLLSVQPDSFITLDDPPSSSSRGSRLLNSSQAEWGIRRIQAEEAVKLLNESTSGSLPEIRVATVDTGVRVTHEALRDNYLGKYGWLDPYMATPEPNDQNGHGTHTTGTICGTRGIGVFPQAKWMSCKGCSTSSCARSALLTCAQYIACPTLHDHSAPNCSLAPHVVSNSWGGGRGDSWFDSSIDAWRAGGIIPVFSIGNSGAKCHTASSPGDRPRVIAVGSTVENDTISAFSSTGPTTDGQIKPDFSAPGSDVLSAYHTGDDVYDSMSGTSMACPHVAGLTTLLLAYDPNLSYTQIVNIIQSGVETASLIPPANVTCDGIPSDVFPNHIFGHGLINAFQSLVSLIDSRSSFLQNN